MKLKSLRQLITSGLLLILFVFPINSNPAAAADTSDLQKLKSKVGEHLKYSIDANTQKLTFIKGGEEGLPFDSPKARTPLSEATARQIVREYGTYFGLREPLKESTPGKITTDKKENNHIRFNQTYAGIPVFGGQLIVHVKKDGSVKAINGRVVPDVSLDTSPKISQAEGVARAKELWKEQFGLDEAKVITAELYILNQSLIDPRFEDKNYLVWRIELRNEKAIKDEFYFIDAHTGELVYQLTGIKNVINREIWDGSLIYYIVAWGIGYDYLGHTFGRTEGSSATGTNPLFLNSGVDDLYDGVGYCHDYFYETFGIDGANDSGGLGDGITEDLDISRVKAYLDGYYDYIGYAGCPNAYSNDYEIAFCYGMEVTDVVAHEYGHSVLNFAVYGIPYTSEPGAVHEAYADITGEAVEYYNAGSNDWLNGGDITLVSSTPRSLINPEDYDDGLGDNPSTYFSDGFYCGSSDNYGVHHNCTVISHAAYLMAMGGTESSCTVRALGRAREEQVFYQMIENYITTAVDFNQVYDGLLLACDDLYEDAYCTEVKRAAQAVEIDQSPGPCDGGSEDTPDCAADQFPDVSSGHTFYDYIQNLGYGEVVNGYGDGTFRPGNNVTRGQMAKFVKNGFGFETDTSCTDFPDVPPSYVFYDHITTLKCEGVISGYPDGTFRPRENVTRGQAMKFVINGAREKQGDPNFLPIDDPPPTFPDVPVGHTFYNHIMAARSNEIVSGYPDGYFKPSNTASRGAMSKMVDNTRGKIYFPD